MQTTDEVAWTEYSGLTATQPASIQRSTWDVFTKSLIHQRLPDKRSAPGFGPYECVPSLRPCQHAPTKGAPPHRCDACVAALTMAVFDADAGDERDVWRCSDALRADGVAHVLYSSFSYSPTKAAFRLVVPLSTPVPSGAWGPFRSAVISRYQIPCVESQCCAPSHFYYRPSCPPDAEPVIVVEPGAPLDVSQFPLVVVDEPLAAAVVGDFEWPTDTKTDPDEEEANRSILKRIRSLRQGSIYDRRKAVWLGRLLDGKALDEPGLMHDASLRTTGVLAWLFPYASRAFFERLLTPSIEAMAEVGAKNAHVNVFGMLESALRKELSARAASDAILAGYEEACRRALQLAEECAL